jgi:hypothetical protein
MDLVGEILYVEASRLGVAHPFFARPSSMAE